MSKFIGIRMITTFVLLAAVLVVIATIKNNSTTTHPLPTPPPVVVENPISPVVVETPPITIEPTKAPSSLDDLERLVTELERRVETTTSDYKAQQAALDALGNK